jgi:hypothetical protein
MASVVCGAAWPLRSGATSRPEHPAALCPAQYEQWTGHQQSGGEGHGHAGVTPYPEQTGAHAVGTGE